MRPGRHAAEDGSFRRSAGMAVGRAALLLLVAVILGIFLLNQIDDEGATTVDLGTETTEPDDNGDAVVTTTSSTTSTTVRAARPPAEVKVLAVNGTTTSGIGARTKDVLITNKYNALAPTDAAAKLKPLKVTVIYYQPGYDVDALAVAQLFQLTVANTKPMPADINTQVKESRNVANSHIVVMAGEDIVSKLPAQTTTTTAAKSSTTTTAKPASTTTTAKP